MTYALYADEWPMTLIRQRLDRSDRHLFTELLAHCTRHLTDGVIDVPVGLITDHEDAEAGVQHLIDAGMLERNEDTLVIAEDYYRHQPKREVTLKKQEASRITSQRNRMHNSGDHSLCDPKRCWVLRGNRDTSRDTSREHVSDVPQYDPIQSDPQRIGEKRIEGSDDPGLEAGSSTPSRKVTGVHVGVDTDATDTCDLCGQPIKSKIHQKVPAEITTAVWMAHKRGIPAYVAVHDLSEESWGISASECEFQLTFADDKVHFDAAFSTDDPAGLRQVLGTRFQTVYAGPDTVTVSGWSDSVADAGTIMDAICEAREPRHEWASECCQAPINSPIHRMPADIAAVLSSLNHVKARAKALITFRDPTRVVAETTDHAEIDVQIEGESRCTLGHPWPERLALRDNDIPTMVEILKSDGLEHQWEFLDKPQRIVARGIALGDLESYISAAPADIVAAREELALRRKPRVSSADDALAKVLSQLQAGDAA